MANASATVFHRSRLRARNNSLDKNTAHLCSPVAAGRGRLFYREPHRYQPPPKPKTTSARQASCAYISDSHMKSLASTRRNGRSNLEVVSPRLLEPHEAPAGDCVLAKPNFDHFLTEPAEKTSYSLSRRSCNLSILVDRCVAP